MASIIVMLFSSSLTALAFLKINNFWLRLLTLIVILVLGWFVAFTLGYYLGEYYGDKKLMMRYLGNGFWWSLIGVFVGRFSVKQYIKRKAIATEVKE